MRRIGRAVTALLDLADLCVVAAVLALWAGLADWAGRFVPGLPDRLAGAWRQALSAGLLRPHDLATALAVAAAAAICACVIGLVLGALMWQTCFPGRAAVLALLGAPIVIAALVALLWWRLALLPPAATPLRLLAIRAAPGVPLVLMLVLHRLPAQGRRLLRDAALSGAGPVRRLRPVVLPLAAPGAASGALLAFALAFAGTVAARLSPAGASPGGAALVLFCGVALVLAGVARLRRSRPA